jgi:hypothetical protein
MDEAGHDAPDAARTGGCLCGTVRYRVALPALWVAHCHCSMCRRAQGAAFVTWAGFADAGVTVVRGAEQLEHYRSSETASRSFCRRCGTQLMFRSSRWPGETHVTLATLDDATGLEPRAHAYRRDRVAWIGPVDPELPAIEPPDHDAAQAPA